MQKMGIVSDPQLAEFWKSLNLNIEFNSLDWDQAIASNDIFGIVVFPEAILNLSTEIKIIGRETLFLHYFDYLKKTKSGFLPISHLRDHAIELIRMSIKSLDTRKKAYISGNGTWAREFCFVAAQIGYKEISLIQSKEEDDLNSMKIISELQKLLFGIRFTTVPESELTLQSNDGSLLVNALDSEKQQELTQDMSYLNFLSLQGLVIDINEQRQADQKNNLLVHESKISEIACIDGFLLRAFIEHKILITHAGLKSCLFKDYLEKRRSFLVKSP